MDLTAITDTFKEWAQNPYLVGFIIVGTVLYASMAQPNLPPNIAKWFDYPLVKMLVYALIVLLMTQNLQVAIVVAIAFYVLMSLLREQKIAEGFVEALRTEGFYADEQMMTASPSMDPTQSPDMPLDPSQQAQEPSDYDQLKGRVDRFCQSSRNINCDQLKEHVNILCPSGLTQASE